MKDELLERRLRQIQHDIELSVRAEMNGLIENNVGVIIKKSTEVYTEIINIPLSVKQVALLTGMSKQAVYKWCQRGNIKVHREDKGGIFIYLKDITEMLLPKIHKAITTSA